MTERQMFSAEFKREAVRLLESGDRKAAALARDLGVRRNLLYKWRDEIRSKGDDAFSRKPGPKPAAEASEVERLRRELEAVKAERDILKKAAAYFARELP